MSRIARFAVLVTALASLLGVMSSAAGAVTWHNTGSTSFTATGGPSTLSRGAVNFACTSSSTTGTAAGGSTVADHYTITVSTSYSPCTLAGQASSASCHVVLTLPTQPAGGVSVGTDGIDCTVRITASGTNVCRIHGRVPVSYTNPSGGAAGKVTISASSTLSVTNSTSACPLGTGTGASTHQTITVTNGSPTSLGPVLTRTA